MSPHIRRLHYPHIIIVSRYVHDIYQHLGHHSWTADFITERYTQL
uniref:Uncharacterized protein n=1 Tax=Arundo donax TaxID=35708 RepID=A0A0A9EKD5_ARUDO